MCEVNQVSLATSFRPPFQSQPSLAVFQFRSTCEFQNHIEKCQIRPGGVCHVAIGKDLSKNYATVTYFRSYDVPGPIRSIGVDHILLEWRPKSKLEFQTSTMFFPNIPL